MNALPAQGIYLLSPLSYDRIYSHEERAAITKALGRTPPFIDASKWHNYPDVCQHTQIILSGWGMAVMDERFLSAFPNLKLVLYGAGAVDELVTEAFWERGITISSAHIANSIPVAEFTVAQIVLAVKQMWQLSQKVHRSKSFPPMIERESVGMYRSVVGLISLGTIGRMVAERLQAYDVEVIAYDPCVTEELAARMGVRLCPLEEVFACADVISCHAPWLKETEGMLRRRHFSAMKPKAVFINTARGAVVNEPDLISVLQERPDIYALLDVTFPEPPAEDSLLYTLPNISLSPHIAGSKGNECHRLGYTMVEELERYLAGKPLKFEISRERSLSVR